jgi:hypothetical protein
MQLEYIGGTYEDSIYTFPDGHSVKLNEVQINELVEFLHSFDYKHQMPKIQLLEDLKNHISVLERYIEQIEEEL